MNEPRSLERCKISIKRSLIRNKYCGIHSRQRGIPLVCISSKRQSQNATQPRNPCSNEPRIRCAKSKKKSNHLHGFLYCGNHPISTSIFRGKDYKSHEPRACAYAWLWNLTNFHKYISWNIPQIPRASRACAHAYTRVRAIVEFGRIAQD